MSCPLGQSKPKRLSQQTPATALDDKKGFCILPLCTSTNWHNRRILEAWEINTCRNPLNRGDGMHLPHDFLNLALRDRT